ncbi:nucleic-acid-binding protein from transposon X-element [Trichonephila inaurata madagascariensis]|uniref:Nucleic-acid-binding protein from transposon X-element n=1 Tax=Trichonephila inaurata madagascariensis TaxID=2747483 RepID=A0A8X6XLZ2_9ARAC|nr:nucleic-acid-binding protein from transposon X-element [Trichonephila inaurata madagascariensis]
MPSVRGKLSGEYLKLYTDTFEDQRALIHLLEELDFEFYAIPAKTERPIKVVIKGLPHDTPTYNIHNELIDPGFSIDKVTQLIGRITKQKLPIFQVTLPRNMHITKIFDLNQIPPCPVSGKGGKLQWGVLTNLAT